MCRYEWHGIASLADRLTALQASPPSPPPTAVPTSVETDAVTPTAAAAVVEAARSNRKDRSMSRLTERFVKMFMLSPGGMLELEVAATALLGPAEEGEKSKTKVRRLYDIANILRYDFYVGYR